MSAAYELETLKDAPPANDTNGSEKASDLLPEVPNIVPFVPTTIVRATPEPSEAVAFPIKPYRPETQDRMIMEMNSVLDSDKRALIGSDDSISSEDDSDYDRGVQVDRRQSVSMRRKWWFQEPAVRKNCCIVFGAWCLVLMGIASFLTGIILEIFYHLQSQDIIRGVIFVVVSVIILVPSVYAVTHVYLAARRVGRVRFSSVWFFR